MKYVPLFSLAALVVAILTCQLAIHIQQEQIDRLAHRVVDIEESANRVDREPQRLGPVSPSGFTAESADGPTFVSLPLVNPLAFYPRGYSDGYMLGGGCHAGGCLPVLPPDRVFTRGTCVGGLVR